MKIVLIGYMASGKSAVGLKLSYKYNLLFVDLDDYIEKKEKKTISTIFKEKGEIYFRLKEAEYLEELLTSNENLVLSLGGGTPCYGNNMDVIIKNSISYYLKTSINTIHSRLILEKNKRPLVANIKEENLSEFIAKHLFERSIFYQRSNKTITTDQHTIDEVVDMIEFD